MMSKKNLIDLIKETSNILLAGDTRNLEKSLLTAMELMARYIDVDRMYIWKTRIKDGKHYYEQQYEWLGKAGEENTLFDVTGEKTIDSIPQWEEVFASQGHLNGPISTIPGCDFCPYGIRSILVLPLFLHEKFWGFVSFDDMRKERSFPEDEVTALHSGSLLLANSIENHLNKVLIETRIKQQELMADISGSFISRDPMDKLINDAMKKMGEFMGVSRILIAEMDKDSPGSHLLFTWLSSMEWQPKKVNSGIKENIQDSFPKSIPDTGFITAICCNDIENEYSGRFKKFIEADIKSFIWAPVYVDGNLWGIISIEDCLNERIWSESDVQLAGTVSSAIAGAVARDIIDKARTAALEHAVKTSQAKGYFLANMSHEMRTPMNAIIGMTTIGKNSRDLVKKDYAFEKIENASTHLLGVINDVLDISKIEANKLELSQVTFNFEDMLHKVVNVISFRIDERQQEFTVHIDVNIPRFIVGDDHRLAQVITNLLSNAAKFTPDKGKIHLDAKLVDTSSTLHTIQIEVIDTGIGISQEQQEKLFNSYEQAESTTSRKFGGTGLGLAISKRIVELMGGQIWIKSEVGKGADFGFSIRVEEGQGTNAGITAPNVIRKNFRILAVDDNPDVLDYFSEIMQWYGIKGDVASNGDDAIALIKKNGLYDLYFIDWAMPDMDGMELSRKIRDFGNENIVPKDMASMEKSTVIMISGTQWDSIEEEAKKAGVDMFLPKPLFPPSIIDTINLCLDKNLSLDRQEEKSDAGEKSLELFTMLLAEDVDINREIITTLLEPSGIKIDSAENGREAVEKFRSAPDKYDIILMDIQMPELDGYEATRQIRTIENGLKGKSLNRPIPIIAMTANVFREDIEKCLAAGMDDHLGKPLDIEDVLSKLERYLK